MQISPAAGWLRRSTKIAPAALMLCVAVALSACGSGDSSSSAPDKAKAEAAPAAAAAPKCGAGTGKPATGQPIQVGAMETNTGGPSTAEGPATAKAFYACLNANGGINGRPVVLTIVDDGLDPAKAARGASTLLEDKNVVAVAGSASYLECPIAEPMYKKAGVYAMEGVGGSAQCFTGKNISSTTQGVALTTSATVSDLITEGAKKISLVVPNTPGLGDAAEAAGRRTAKANGGSIVKVVIYKPGVQDATTVVLDAMAAQPDAIALVGLKQDNVTILKAAQSQDLKSRVKFGCVYPCYSPEVPKQLGAYWAGGALRVVHQFSPFDATTPDNKLWRDVMAKYAPDVIADELSQGSFLAAKIFADTMLKLDGEITRSTAGGAISRLAEYQSDMICTPFAFGKPPFHVSNTAGRVAIIEGDAWKDVAPCAPIKDPLLSQGA